jgi:DNA mismatch endonuclease, patch repair protein
MTDVMTPAQRSRCMSRIHGKNTSPELKLRKALWEQGVRYRIAYRLPGKPDLVFVKAKLAVFVDGCFWHGCPKHGVSPSSNSLFWKNKLCGNKARDHAVNFELDAMGWKVLRFWEHEIRGDLDGVCDRIKNVLLEKR